MKNLSNTLWHLSLAFGLGFGTLGLTTLLNITGAGYMPIFLFAVGAYGWERWQNSKNTLDSIVDWIAGMIGFVIGYHLISLI